LFYSTRDVLAKNSWNLYKGGNNRKQETEKQISQEQTRFVDKGKLMIRER
jgi:hypothetical protein